MLNNGFLRYCFNQISIIWRAQENETLQFINSWAAMFMRIIFFLSFISLTKYFIVPSNNETVLSKSFRNRLHTDHVNVLTCPYISIIALYLSQSSSFSMQDGWKSIITHTTSYTRKFSFRFSSHTGEAYEWMLTFI